MPDKDRLLTRAIETLEADGRMRAAWLTGSRARGTEDRFSDLDFWLVVEEKDKAAFIEDWPKLSDRVAPSVLRQKLFGSTFTHVTEQWERWDVSIGVPADVPKRTRTTVKPLFDRDGLNDRLKPVGEPLLPDAAKVSGLVTEFLRVMGLLPVVLGREEYVVGVSGAGLLRGMIIQLFLEDAAVEDRGGALHLSTLLPPQRLQALADLPAAEATRESVLEAHLACARLFLPHAREMAARIGVAWPEKLQDALNRRLDSCTSASADRARRCRKPSHKPCHRPPVWRPTVTIGAHDSHD